MTRKPGRYSSVGRRVLVVALGLMIAVAIALGTGRSSSTRLEATRPTVTVPHGQVREVAGVSFGLDRFDVAATFPAEDPGDDEARGPDGSMIVFAVIRQTITDRRIRPDDYYCDITLHSPDTGWLIDSDYTSSMRRPKAMGCASTKQTPIRYDQPRLIGVTFVVPAAALKDQLSVWVSVNSGADVVALSR